jgi:hypothetical protein
VEDMPWRTNRQSDRAVESGVAAMAEIEADDDLAGFYAHILISSICSANAGAVLRRKPRMVCGRAVAARSNCPS